MTTVSIASEGVVESSSNFIRFTVTLSSAPIDAVTMSYRTLLNGTANDEDLWNPSTHPDNNGQVTFAPGETSQDVFIRTTGDSRNEADEAITLELFNLSDNAAFNGGELTLRSTGVIGDDPNDGSESNLAIFVSDPVLVEDNTGTKNAVFEIRLSEPAPSTFTVNYTTADGSAVAGEDYTFVSGSETFFSGQEVAFVSVPVRGDRADEATETFSLIVTPPSNPRIDTTGAVGEATILDDDSGSGPVLSVAGGEAVESSSHFLRFTLSLSEVPIDAVTLSYRTLLNGTAGDGDTWNPSTHPDNNGTVTFAPGQTSLNVFVRTTGDSADEQDEAVTLELYNLSDNASFAGGEQLLRSTGIILDDPDDIVTTNLSVIVSDPVLEEGDNGTKIALFEIHLSQPAPSGFTVDYTTVNGTARAGQDYTKTTGSLTFAEGQQTAWVSVDVFGDRQAEQTEFFSLVVDTPDNVAISTLGAAGQATIFDDDTSNNPVISVSSGATVESSSHFVRYTLFLSEASDDPVTVDFATTLGTASDSDLWNPSTHPDNNGTVTFEPGQTSRDIFIRTTGDSADERDETIFLTLSDPTGARLAGGEETLSTVGFIQDNDGLGLNIALSGTPQTVTETAERSQVIEIPIELSRPDDETLDFDVNAINGTARSGRDFELMTDTLSFDPGQTMGAVRVRIFGDASGENTETFAVGFEAQSGEPFTSIVQPTVITINDGRGYVEGTNGRNTLEGGSGADTIIGLGGDDTLRGRDGNDDLFGDDGRDKLFGGNDADDLRGGNGRDDLRGGDGGDDLRGGNGGDSLRGEDGGDELRGNDGNDTLRGGNGSDELNGGTGNDVLIGQKGQDDLIGGSGSDSFVFSDRSHSGTKGSTRDDIEDFSRGQDDVIDLSDLVGGRLDFRGDRNFQRNNDNQIRLEDTGDGIRIEIDFNGDRRSDFEIDVEDISRLREGDFLL